MDNINNFFIYVKNINKNLLNLLNSNKNKISNNQLNKKKNINYGIWFKEYSEDVKLNLEKKKLNELSYNELEIYNGVILYVN